MKKIFTILMALMVLCLTQCKPTPEVGDDNNGNDTRKVKVRCEIAINKGTRSDFTNLIENGKINWSHGRECVYVSIHGSDPQIIELESWSEGNPPVLEFSGEAAEGLIAEGEEYDVWYFGHSQQLDVPYVNMVGNNKIEGSIANQSGRLDDLGYCHIAMTKVKAEMEDGEVKLKLSAVLKTQIAIALLDLENVTELYGDAIVGTEYSLEYNEGIDRYELNVVEDADARISVESASGISYVVLLPNDNKESTIKSVQDTKVYGYTFRNYIKSPKVYCRVASDGTTVEALPWTLLDEEYAELPKVTTSAVSEITINSAVCGGEVTSDGNGTITARGICWSTSQNPTISDNKTIDGSGTGSFTSNLSNLASQTTYYVRAYATNEVGTAYGEEMSFTTLKPTTGTENGHDWVDLGLPSGTKWATCNVGASSPEEYGDYFAWGETTTKETYTVDNCPTYGLSYPSLQSQGYIDGEGNLASQYDAATVNWGGTWRMPTYKELNELSANCTWTWTTQNGVKGYKVKGPNGNSIFLPAAGYRNGLSLNGAGSGGHYWTPKPYVDYAHLAYRFVFGSSNYYVGNDGRSIGNSVRPVLE